MLTIEEIKKMATDFNKKSVGVYLRNNYEETANHIAEVANFFAAIIQDIAADPTDAQAKAKAALGEDV